jgi:hypothetical protein
VEGRLREVGIAVAMGAARCGTAVVVHSIMSVTAPNEVALQCLKTGESRPVGVPSAFPAFAPGWLWELRQCCVLCA